MRRVMNRTQYQVITTLWVPCFRQSKVASIENPGARIFRLKDGREFFVDPDCPHWGEVEMQVAEGIARAWCGRNDFKWPDDLATAFVSTDQWPGLKILAQSPEAQGFEGVIMRTTDGELVLVHFDVKED